MSEMRIIDGVKMVECDSCLAFYESYGTQEEPQANRIDLVFEFPNKKGLQKIKSYRLCPQCMQSIIKNLECEEE